MQVVKKHVDSYKPGRRIPRCQLSAVFNGSDEKCIPALQYHVKLIGVRGRYKMIAIAPPIPLGT